MSLQGSIQKLTSQLVTIQKQKADLEAALKESVKQNEEAIAKLTSEKEDLEKKLAELRKYQVSMVQLLFLAILS